MNAANRNSAPEVSVIIPVYNEEEVIADTLTAVTAWFRQCCPHEILLCDDGSTDATASIAADRGIAELKIIKLSHAGKGAAVKAGMLKAAGRFTIFMDADLSTPPDESAALLRELRSGAPIVIGSRRITGLPASGRQPRHRHYAGNIYALLARTLLLPDIHDPQCGFKGFDSKIAKKLAALSRINGFAFDTELLVLARRLGIAVREIQVKWNDSGNSSVSLPRHGLAMLCDLLRIAGTRTSPGAAADEKKKF